LNSVDALCITVLSNNINITKEIIKQVKEKDQDIFVVIGGPHCNIFPKKSLEETGADICVQGDGEKAILDIRNELNNEHVFSEISGVFYKLKHEIKSGRHYKLIKNLDNIPFPARHLIKKYNYGRFFNKSFKKGEFTTILTERGCSSDCRFCSQCVVNLNQYRTRSANNILDELKDLTKTEYKHIGIMDDNFLADKKKANYIFDNLIKEKINLNLYLVGSHINSADEKLYFKMKKAGVIYMHYNLISGDQSILDFYNTKTTIGDIRQTINLSHDIGFFTSGTFFLGAPTETLQKINNTINFSKSLPLNKILFTPLRYIAGSNLWFKAVDEEKILKNEYYIPADSRKNLSDFTIKELYQYCKKAQNSNYYRPKYFINLLKFFSKKKRIKF